MKSPFIIVPDFLSPQLCENILADIHVKTPNLDKMGEPIKLEKTSIFWDQEIVDRFRDVIPTIESKYNCLYKGLERPVFQHYPENSKVPAEPPGCENSKYLRRKWVMYKNVDLVGFIWLKNYNNEVPIDSSYEVYGGKLEFPGFNFSFTPQRGTLVLFPAGPHFITAISPVLVSDLYQIKLNVSIEEKTGGQWFYQPKNFSGTWSDWLNEYM